MRKKKRELVPKLSARNVWGKVIVYLKEKKFTSLYVATGDISEVEIENGCLVVTTDKDFLVDMLSRNKKDIQSAIAWQGLNLEFTIKRKIILKSKSDEDLEKLKKFGNFLKIR